MPPFPNEYDYEESEEYIPDESEIEPTRPYTAEERAELDELYARMAADLAKING